VYRLISHEKGVLIMLVLTRKCQEVVVVSGADGFNVLLKVTVLGIENGKVRLGFEAASIAWRCGNEFEQMPVSTAQSKARRGKHVEGSLCMVRQASQRQRNRHEVSHGICEVCQTRTVADNPLLVTAQGEAGSLDSDGEGHLQI
jgi:hypothetical protein